MAALPAVREVGVHALQLLGLRPETGAEGGTGRVHLSLLLGVTFGWQPRPPFRNTQPAGYGSRANVRQLRSSGPVHLADIRGAEQVPTRYLAKAPSGGKR
jgi:hypothetical protein